MRLTGERYTHNSSRYVISNWQPLMIAKLIAKLKLPNIPKMTRSENRFIFTLPVLCLRITIWLGSRNKLALVLENKFISIN